MAVTILTSFRNVTKYPSGDIADTDVRTNYMAVALHLYNTIMGTTYTIATDTTGNATVDLALAWLAASIRYSEDRTTSRDNRRGGLLEWEKWQQHAFELMALMDRTKFMFSGAVGLYVPRTYDSTWLGAYMRNDATDGESYVG